MFGASEVIGGRPLKRAGFTLVELLMATTIGGMLLAITTSAVLSMAVSSRSMLNYTEMNAQMRLTLETFSRDVRMARNVEQASPVSIRLVREIEGLPRSVEYAYSEPGGTLRRTVRDAGTQRVSDLPGADQTLLWDVKDLALHYYTLRNRETLNPFEIKHVQLEAVMQRTVLTLDNTHDILSARFMMRNRDVSK